MLSSVFQVGKSCGELSGVDEIGGWTEWWGGTL